VKDDKEIIEYEDMDTLIVAVAVSYDGYDIVDHLEANVYISRRCPFCNQL
jgi:hypothetical protein